MIISLMGVDADAVAAGHDAWAHVRSVVEELTGEGTLDERLVDGFVFPVYERTMEEVERPFAEALGERLSLEHATIVRSPSPAVLQYRERGDAAELADGFVGFFRAFSEPSLRADIDPSNRALDELYRRLHQRIADNADDFDFTVGLVSLAISART